MAGDWEELAGITLPRGYVLEKYLGDAEDGAFYLTSYGLAAAPDDDATLEPRPGLLKLVAGHLAATGQLAAWERLAEVSHPNVLAVLDSGRAPVRWARGGGYFLFAVFEYPDDHLTTALDAGDFPESDAREVLNAVEAGLQFLHANGLAHTAVDPRHIVAVGDRIQLSSDSVKPLGPDATEAEDWRALAALRGRLLGWGESAPEAPAPAPLEAAAPVAPVAVTSAAAAREDAWQPQLPPARPASSMDSTVEESRHAQRKFWGYAALAVVAVFLLVLALRPKTAAQAPRPVPVPIVTAQIPAEPAVHPSARPPVHPAATPSDPSNWRVVAFTYTRRKDADHKMAQISSKFPGFVPEVISPKTGWYLVTLGGRMTRTQARTLQHQALSKGMPSGTYVQNFNN